MSTQHRLDITEGLKMNNGMLWLIVGLGALFLLGGRRPYHPALPGQTGGITIGTGEVLYEGMEY